jgi:CDP-glucose 4,6-dehydratase
VTTREISGATPNLWRDRRVLVTGHTGFKGAWLTLWLSELGAMVTGASLPTPVSEPNLFDLAGIAGRCDDIRCDVRDLAALDNVFAKSRPEVVFHLAAQALVRRGYRDPILTFGTNVQGTANVLAAARRCPTTRAVVVVTSDKCYRPSREHRPFVESDPLGGTDPYSASKASAEMVVAGSRSLTDMPPVATVRAGNVIGGGDWGEDRLIPDLARALAAGRATSIRHPRAVRPWQHVLDCLSGYIEVGRRIADEAPLETAFNFGPDDDGALTVGEVSTRFNQLTSGVPWRDLSGDDGPGFPETPELRLSSSFARSRLGWRPKLDIGTAITWTAEWYRDVLTGTHAEEACRTQLDSYLAA